MNRRSDTYNTGVEIVGILLLAVSCLAAGYGFSKLQEQLKASQGWQPETPGERKYGRPMIEASDGNITCRYWHWEHPFTTDRATIEECITHPERKD